MRKVRIGLIGCGGIMGVHVSGLAKMKEAKIAALADTSAEMLQRFLRRFPELRSLPRFPDYRAMLEQVPLDGVVISTPHTTHFEQIMEGLGRGLHVLCEKPMVCSVQEAKKVIRKARASGKVMMIAYQRHFSPAFRQAREIIARGALGRLHSLCAMQAQNWYLATQGSWRQDPALSGGGQLNDSGSHLVDIILWVTGLVPAEAFAYIEKFQSKVDIVSAASMKFKGGALGTLTVVGHSPGWWEDISFWGEEGALYVRDGRLLRINYDGEKRLRGKALEDITGEYKYEGSPAKNFIDSILGRDTPQTPPECGLRVAQLTEALWESAKAGQPVKVKA